MKLETYLALCLQPAGVWFGLFANNEVVSEGGTNPLDGNLVTSERYQCHVSVPFVTSQCDYFQKTKQKKRITESARAILQLNK